MSDKNYPPYSKAFYEEIEAEIETLKKESPKNSVTDIELIRIHLDNMETAVCFYRGLIETALQRLAAKKGDD